MRDISDTVEIAPGVAMPRLGLGTYRSAAGAETQQAVLAALRAGYRSVDTAAFYGNEADVSSAIRASELARDEVFVATKVWNDDQGFDSTLRAFDASLKRFDFDRVDLYLIHWPLPSRMRDTWRAMERIVESGRARAIGVCNFLPHHLEKLLEYATVPPAVDQVEFHVRLQQPGLQRFCSEHSIVLEAWAPLMRGGLHRIPEVVGIARRREHTPEQVALRWILQKGHIAIPKSVHAGRIRANAAIFDFELTAEEMAVLDSLDTGERIGSNPDKFADM